MLRRISIHLSFSLFVFIYSFAFAKTDIAIITNQEANTVDVIDLKKKEKISEILVGEKPAGVFIDKDNKIFFTSNPGTNKILYVSNWLENKISIIDINKNKILSKINVGNSPAGIFLSNDEKLFIALKGDNLVSVYDLISKKKNHRY